MYLATIHLSYFELIWCFHECLLNRVANFLRRHHFRYVLVSLTALQHLGSPSWQSESLGSDQLVRRPLCSSVFCNVFCVLQPVGRFCCDGVSSVKASVPPGSLAELHRPELDPGCGPACCHGKRMITGDKSCRINVLFP